MKDTFKNSVGDLGIGAAAAAAGFGAANVAGEDKSTALMVGAGTGLMATLISHLIRRKVSERGPIMGVGEAAVASGAAGIATSGAALTGLNFIENSGLYKTMKDGLSTWGKQTRGRNSLGEAAGQSYDQVARLLNSASKVNQDSGKFKKAISALSKNKKLVGAGLLGMAAMPFTYDLLRGNGSD